MEGGGGGGQGGNQFGASFYLPIEIGTKIMCGEEK